MRNSSQGWLHYEEEAYRAGYQIVAGVDEAGRGPIAGPVVAAAVIIPYGVVIDGINDSKILSRRRREELYEIIIRVALDWNVGITDHILIDRLNILRATYLAMKEAILKLNPVPNIILADGFQIPDCHIKQIGIKKGDGLSQSIAAASVLAKITRDRMMRDYDSIYPEYGFGQHKGYPTQGHREAINEHGVCDIHRRSFRPIKEIVDSREGRVEDGC